MSPLQGSILLIPQPRACALGYRVPPLQGWHESRIPVSESQVPIAIFLRTFEVYLRIRF